jgi:hypothetical protein
MLVHVAVTGYFDWAPCPPGTQITQADKDALRVKQMSDESYQMRVEMKADTHHDVRIPELAITDRMASLELLGHPQSREATVAEILKFNFTHHLHTKHIVEITIDDDGPNEELYKSELARLNVPADRLESALANYMDEADIAAYLNTVFKAKKFKKAKVTQ